MYDLNLIPVNLEQGQPVEILAGFQAAAPPRRTARGRSDDLLILSFISNEVELLSSELQQNWLNKLSDAFFKTGGTVTAALRTLIETLNLTMMEKNLKMAQGGETSSGAVNLAAIHNRSLYLAQSGSAHAYTLTPQGLQHFYDASQTDRGLGYSRTPTIRYYHTNFGSGGYFFVTDTPPETWTEDLLLNGEFPKLEQLRRRLLNQAPSNFRLDLVQALPGEGRINFIQPKIAQTKAEEQVSTQPQAIPETEKVDAPVAVVVEEPENIDMGDTQEIKHSVAQAPEVSPEIDGETTSNVMEEVPGDGEADEGLEGAARNEEEGQRIAPDTEPQPEVDPQTVDETSASARAVLQARKQQFQEKGLNGLASFFDWWHNAGQKVSTFFKDFIARWSQGGDGSIQISRRTLWMIAVGVPLIVVAAAVGVYLARGRTLQYQSYYEQAELASLYAIGAEDASMARNAWMEALGYLDAAESYKRTNEIETLRDKAQRALDSLDGAVRLSYRPAINGTLYSEITITRIVSYGTDLYLLDLAGGRVIHGSLGSQGYEIDSDFVCAAGSFSGGSVGALVDMVSLPINNPYQAHILAADETGNVVYCAPGQEPLVQPLPARLENQGGIKRIAYENTQLYTLNPTNGSVYVYRSTNGQFIDDPIDYFEGVEVGQKPDLTQMVDLAVNGSELYLLRANGVMVNCVVTGLSGNPVNCENPVSYVDGRAGMEDSPVALPESDFISVFYTLPPDPSINVLDASSGDIYRFSVRFRLYRCLRPAFGDYEIESPAATAFTIGIDRVAYIAYGHQLFYAYVD